MKHIIKTVAVSILLLVLLSAHGLAEDGRKGLFDFINAYSTPVTQPDLTPNEQEALMMHPEITIETQYAKYTVTDAAFDGRVLYVLVEAVPCEDVLLISGYGYEDADQIIYEDGESGGETFAQRAWCENKKLIVSAISSAYTADEIGLEGESYSEAFYSDGRMQLYGRIPIREYAPHFDGQIKICEAVYGEPLSEERIDLRIDTTAHMEKGVWEGELSAGLLTVTKVVFNRSEIAASVWITARVKETLSETEAEKACFLEVMTPDSIEFSSGYYIMNAQGDMQWENPTGGESLLFVMSVVVGEALPDSMTFAIRNYDIKEILGEFSVPLAAASPD